MSTYTKDETDMCVQIYTANPSMEMVELLSEKLGRSKKSIIGKLSREGVYKRESYRTKTGELPTTKVEMVSNIADTLGIELHSLEGLEKSPKNALRALSGALEKFGKE